jgi:hypothetical protein
MTAALLKSDGDMTAPPAPAEYGDISKLAAAIGKSHHYDDAEDFAYGTGRYASPAAANDNLPPVVAFTGVAGSGKSTVTKYLVERHGYTLVKFAGPLKDMMRALGFGEDDIEGGDKELSNRLLNDKTPRYAMQTLGTEWGRNCIGENFWVDLWKDTAERIVAQGGRVVTDDCRFPNEAATVARLNGRIIKIEGRGGIAGQHVSEAGCGVADAVVVNDGSVEQLKYKVWKEVA